MFNPTIDFWMFTDNENIQSEENIKVEHLSFDKFREYLQSIFDFSVACGDPYKLCDYKPVYGEVFAERLKDYDWWGYCDIDLILGNVRKFITDDILDMHDKIFVSAHISIFKNCQRMNSLFRNLGNYPEYNYLEAYKTNDACYFDEFRGMELKCIRNEIKVYNDTNICLDVNPANPQFVVNEIRNIAVWDKGQLVTYSENGTSKEIMYIHIQKRKMYLKNKSAKAIERMEIVPGLIICNKITNAGDLFNYSSGGGGYTILWKFGRLKKQLHTYTPLKIIERNKRAKEIARYKLTLLSADKNKHKGNNKK